MKIGDVVYLKSGGVPMTVVAVNDDGTIGTNWMGGSTAFSGVFPPDALAADDPTPVINSKTAKLAATFEADKTAKLAAALAAP